MIILCLAIISGFIIGSLSQYVFGWVPAITLSKIPLLDKTYASLILSGIIGSALTLISTGVFFCLTERKEVSKVFPYQPDSKADDQRMGTPKPSQVSTIVLKRKTD